MEIKKFEKLIKKFEELKKTNPDWIRMDSTDDEATLVLEYEIKDGN